MSLTQRQQILYMLRQGKVCGSAFLEEHIARFGARLGELRDQGYVIETRRCSTAWHNHPTPQFEYVLHDNGRLF